MKDTTTLPFITMTSSLWLHLRNRLVKMEWCVLRKKIPHFIRVVEESVMKAPLRRKGLGYHQETNLKKLMH